MSAAAHRPPRVEDDQHDRPPGPSRAVPHDPVGLDDLSPAIVVGDGPGGQGLPPVLGSTRDPMIPLSELRASLVPVRRCSVTVRDTSQDGGVMDKQQRLIVIALSVLAFIVGITVLVVALGSTDTVRGIPTAVGALPRLDSSVVEDDVTAQFQDQEGVGLDLSCPDRMVISLGKSYECAGTTADAEDIVILIEITDANGNYTWQEQQ